MDIFRQRLLESSAKQSDLVEVFSAIDRGERKSLVDFSPLVELSFFRSFRSNKFRWVLFDDSFAEIKSRRWTIDARIISTIRHDEQRTNRSQRISAETETENERTSNKSRRTIFPKSRRQSRRPFNFTRSQSSIFFSRRADRRKICEFVSHFFFRRNLTSEKKRTRKKFDAERIPRFFFLDDFSFGFRFWKIFYGNSTLQDRTTASFRETSSSHFSVCSVRR